MSGEEVFFNHITEGYQTKGDYFVLGSAMLDGKTTKDAFVKGALKTLNRHGLISGATGTGKTKMLQVMAENLSEKGIPVLQRKSRNCEYVKQYIQKIASLRSQ